MITQRMLMLVLTLILSSAVSAQVFFQRVDPPRVSVALEVQGDTGAGLILQLGQPVSTTQTFAGPLRQEFVPGESPLASELRQHISTTISSTSGIEVRQAPLLRTLRVGSDSLYIQPDEVRMLEAIAFDAPAAIEDLIGRYRIAFGAGETDTTLDFTFDSLIEIQGEQALSAMSVDGKSALMLFDAQRGLVAGVVEVERDESMAFALLGVARNFELAPAVAAPLTRSGEFAGIDQLVHFMRQRVDVTALDKHQPLEQISASLIEGARRAMLSARIAQMRAIEFVAPVREGVP